MLLNNKEEIEMGLKKKRGRPVTGRAKTIKKSVRLDEEYDSKLDDILDELGISFSDYLQICIRKDWIDMFINRK